MSDNILIVAGAVAAELTERPAVEVAYLRVYLTAVSPGHALAAASRIGEAIGREAVHDVDHGWFDVGDHVTVIYDNEEVRP
jgi:hypothetical protein